MLFFIRTQIVAFLLGVGWIFYFNLLAFLHHPNRAIEYTTPLKFGLLVVIGLLYFLFMKNYIGRRWLALPLIFLPYLFIYHPLFPILQQYMKIGSIGHLLNVEFFTMSTGHLFLMILFVTTILSILFSRRS